MSTVRTEQSDAVLRVTIDRPDQRNALDLDTLEALVAALDGARRDEDVRVVVLTGAGDRAFCSGADLAGGLGADTPAVEAHEARGALRRLFEAAERLDKPLVGRVNGHAVAGGLGVALTCDLLVAVEDATFATPEVRVGLWPYVVSRLLLDHLGPKRALELMMTGRRLSAAEAQGWGLVNRVVARDDLDAAVAELTEQLATAAPLALRLGRRSYYTVRDLPHDEAMAYLHAMLGVNAQTEDVVEGMTAFLEKRTPQWRGR